MSAKIGLIVANSSNLDASFYDFARYDFVLALDGAADKLALQGKRFDHIIGDIDSLRGNYNVALTRVEEQDSTDLDKGVLYMKSHNFQQIDIIGAMGGERMDHSLLNYRRLRCYGDSNIRILEGEVVLQYFKDARLELQADSEQGLAILSMPSCRVSSKGLKYDMHNLMLEFGYTESTSNALIGKAVIEIKGEGLLISTSGTKILNKSGGFAINSL